MGLEEGRVEEEEEKVEEEGVEKEEEEGERGEKEEEEGERGEKEEGGRVEATPVSTTPPRALAPPLRALARQATSAARACWRVTAASARGESVLEEAKGLEPHDRGPGERQGRHARAYRGAAAATAARQRLRACASKNARR